MKKRELRELVNNSSAGYGNEENEEEFNIPVAKVSNVNSEGFFHRDFEIRSFSEKDKNKLLAKNNDLFVVKSSGSKSNILSGKTALYNKGVFPELVASNFLFRLSPDEKEIDPKYLWYFLNSQHSKNYIKTIVGATTYPNLKWNLYGKLPVPVTSLDQQIKISAILDSADEYRQKTKALITKYDELTQSLFLDMFGDPGKKEYNHTEYSMEEIANKVTDGDHATPKRTDAGYKLLSCRNVKQGYIDFEAGVDYVGEDEFNRMYKRCNPEKGDILISCSGTIGRTVSIRIDEPFVLVRSAALIKPKPELVNSLFLEKYLQTSYMQAVMQRKANTSSQANLFTGPIKSLPVLLPSIALQNQFATRVQAIEAQKEQAQKSLTKAEDLFNSLLQKAFKGELTA